MSPATDAVLVQAMTKENFSLDILDQIAYTYSKEVSIK